MGQSVSQLYFHPETGKANLRFLSITTGIILTIYLKAFSFTIGQVKDDSMMPFMRRAGFPFSDTVFYFKHVPPKQKLRGSIVAVRDPFQQGHVVFRRVIADEGQWVQRMDDGGIIKIPKGHVWLECENDNARSLDSLSEDLGGPISKQHVLGRCTSIVWPIWRRAKIAELDKFKSLMGGQAAKHSRVYENEEIFQRYGIR